MARDGRQDGRLERGRHLVGAVQAPVGLLAQERQADAEDDAEQDAQHDRLGGVAGLAFRLEARLDDLRAAGADIGEGGKARGVLAQVRPRAGVALPRIDRLDLLLDLR